MYNEVTHSHFATWQDNSYKIFLDPLLFHPTFRLPLYFLCFYLHCCLFLAVILEWIASWTSLFGPIKHNLVAYHHDINLTCVPF